ncbi:MAG: type I glutamate--ammonia ligase [Alphaproteobacteria bacterium]|nr:type I glutamate--ammonia ligase [Alphaproteobacteria bacterium]
MSDIKSILKMIHEHDVKFVDFRYTDMRGTWHHMAHAVQTVDEDLLTEGIMFDGSSIAGWKAINDSDMILKPDLERAVLDPFSAQPTLIIMCDVLEPLTGQPYNCDPRSIAKAAEVYLKRTNIGDTLYVGPEAEFFIFDNIRHDVSMNRCMVEFYSEESPILNGKKMEEGNHGHRPQVKGAYSPVGPVNAGFDICAEMLTTLSNMGVPIEKYHHEVAPAQYELGIKYSNLVSGADYIQLYKYVVRNVAHSYGKTATFMPKPVKGDNGSGMHVHQSLWKNGKPLFAGNGYADLSQTALYYIGGIIKHAKALNLFTNPTTNSYKRLIPGFEAPVLLAYSARNRSASCRIPYATNPKGKRIEIRFPDPTANPYLAYAALLMAGIDGIENKIHPGDPMDKNLYDLPPEELQNVPTVCGSLREAIEAADKDRAFLKKGEVFTDELIDSYINLKWEECYNYEHTPHPIEFQMYYSS